MLCFSIKYYLFSKLSSSNKWHRFTVRIQIREAGTQHCIGVHTSITKNRSKQMAL